MIPKHNYRLYDYKLFIKLIRGNFTYKPNNFIRNGQASDATKERKARRAKAKVLEYALCNKWEYFYTQTIASDRDRYDKENINKIRKTLNNAKIKYLLCVDRHKDGALHLHGLLMNVPTKYLKDSGVKAFNRHTNKKQPVYNLALTEKYGFNSLFEITTNNTEQRVKIAHYVSGYITKDNNSEFKHRYFASKCLNTRQEIYMSDKYLRDYIANTGLIPDYKNEYADIFILPPDEIKYMSEEELIKDKMIKKAIAMFGEDIVNVQ